MRTVIPALTALALILPAGPGKAENDSPSFWQTPTILGYGKMHYDRSFKYQPDPKETYKIVFDVTKTPSDPSAINSGLDHVARAVNLYVAAGVPLAHLKFVAVLEGDSSLVSLSNEVYRTRFGVDNPNLPLIRLLREKGIDVAVCAQAAALHDIDYAQISHDVTVALSALTTVSTLEHQGYGLVAQ